MICVTIQNRTYDEILDILALPETEMAEIRLDRCTLSDEETEDLFANSDKDLVATCRVEESSEKIAERKLKIAIEAGARFTDLEIEAPVQLSKNIQKLCRQNGTELIRSYHNFDETPSDEVLQRAVARCFRYGADIAKIAVMCHEDSDAARVESLYSIVLEDIDTMEGHLIAFGMGEKGRASRLECLKRGAPYSYCAFDETEVAAPGQWTLAQMNEALYSQMPHYRRTGVRMPASKSFAQRAIIAAALAEGTSHLRGYSPCADSEAAIAVAKALGAEITVSATTLVIKGMGTSVGNLGLSSIHTGESGLLTRLMIPIMSVINGSNVVIEGEGTLTHRPLGAAAEMMAAFGVIVKGKTVPVTVNGPLIPGTADISGQSGSQLISGLLMALPLCGKNSTIYVNEPKSIPYMYITLDVLRHFGIQTRTEMEGDAALLEQQDWSACSGITFNVKGGQRYHAADFDIEGDWSAAANFMVAGAIFGNVEIKGLDTSSLQADLSITDILVEAGANVSLQEDDNLLCVSKAPLEPFDTDLNHAPDIFPICALLAAFCAGESHISGVERLKSKESDRAEAIISMLTQMGVEASVEGDTMTIVGESLSSRILSGHLLKGGNYTSRHDHRMVMVLKVASLGADSPIIIDDEACVSKSFPDFLKLF